MPKLFRSQFSVSLQNFWGSRLAGLGGDRERTNRPALVRCRHFLSFFVGHTKVRKWRKWRK
jgi:hypothetical protein